jgi:regulator of replication initiation timing
MTPEQMLALLQTIADMRGQIGALAQENSVLRAELAKQPESSPVAAR